MTKTNTIDVRALMRAYGCKLIYTNKLANGDRAVKCYASTDRNTRAQLKIALEILAGAENVKFYANREDRPNARASRFGSAASFTVRCDLA